MHRWFTGFLVAAALAGAGVTCGHFRPAARPLYAGPVRGDAEVARLAGPIAKVDGLDVSELGGSFALLPGCHVVELRQKIGEGGVSGAWSTELRQATYAFRMKAGASYEIDVHLEPGNDSVGNANVGRARVEAVERDARGQVVANILPARRPADIEACQRWEEETAGIRRVLDEEPPVAPVVDAGETASRG